MGVYFGATEIAGLYFGDTEITGLYFGDTEIWAAWAEYDGTLPAQYSANGDYLADYRIYGASGGVGDNSSTAYGYEVDMSVRSANLIDVARTNNGTDYYVGGLHWEIAGQSVTLSETSNTMYPQSFLLDSEGNALQLTAGKTYYAKLFVENAPTGSNIYIFLRKKIAGAWSVAYTINTNGVVILASADVEGWTWLLVAQGNGITYSNTRIRIEVSELPIIEYVPYSKAITPIYIGAEPLGEDEYIDYKSGKIYRMSESVLTPTDPPVPLPALPTIDSVNIVNYAGQSAAVPSRFVAKYRKEGF